METVLAFVPHIAINTTLLVALNQSFARSFTRSAVSVAIALLDPTVAIRVVTILSSRREDVTFQPVAAFRTLFLCTCCILFVHSLCK